MGVWTIGIGNMTIRPQVDEKLIKEYIEFSNTCFPKAYGGEVFLNKWLALPIFIVIMFLIMSLKAKRLLQYR